MQHQFESVIKPCQGVPSPGSILHSVDKLLLDKETTDFKYRRETRSEGQLRNLEFTYDLHIKLSQENLPSRGPFSVYLGIHKPRKDILEKPAEPEGYPPSLYQLAKKLTDQYGQFNERAKKLVKEKKLKILHENLNLTKLDSRIIRLRIDELLISALGIGNLKRARNVLKDASSLFPGDEHYNKFNKIIAPPRVLEMKKPATADIKKTISFLKKDGKHFMNKWIAVSHGQLLDVAVSYAELVKKYREKDVIITRVVS